jgi:hypothetical protein
VGIAWASICVGTAVELRQFIVEQVLQNKNFVFIPVSAAVDAARSRLTVDYDPRNTGRETERFNDGFRYGALSVLS